MPADRIIQGEFEGYIKAVYDGLAPGSDQYEHLRGAFFGGALIALAQSESVDVVNSFKAVHSMQRELKVFGRESPIATRPIVGGANTVNSSSIPMHIVSGSATPRRRKRASPWSSHSPQRKPIVPAARITLRRL